MEAVADGPRADHRQLRVDVDRPGARHEEEARLEVLEVVGRERVQPLAVDGEHPAREEAGVEREQPGRVGRARPRCRPRASLTTNVLPSRILIDRRSFLCPSPAAGRRRGAGTGSGSRDRPRPRASRGVPPPSRSPGPVTSRSNSAPSTRTVESAEAFRAGDADVSAIDLDEPAALLLALGDLEANRSLRLREQRLAPPLRQLFEEFRRGIGHRSIDSRPWPEAPTSPDAEDHSLIRPGRMRDTSRATTVTRYSCPVSASMMASRCPRLVAGV